MKSEPAQATSSFICQMHPQPQPALPIIGQDAQPLQQTVRAVISKLPPSTETPTSAAAIPGTQLPESSPSRRARVFELDETHHPKIAQLAISCERFLFSALLGIRDNGTWFVIEGNTGCGKSHVAKRIRRFYNGSKIEFWDGKATHLPNALWGYWPEVVGWDDDDFDDYVAECQVAKLVILDDVGAEDDRYRSGAPSARLARVLERLDGKWVFVTTNVPSKQWKARWDQRVSDRLLAAKRLSLFEVPSYRGKVK